jgi:hypothetical protein
LQLTLGAARDVTVDELGEMRALSVCMMCWESANESKWSSAAMTVLVGILDVDARTDGADVEEDEDAEVDDAGMKAEAPEGSVCVGDVRVR